MVDIWAKPICDSENPQGSRLMTMLTRNPKFVHNEHLRHRSFSFSVSSSRAIPVSKNLEEVRSDELRAGPVWWGREQKGMQSGEELSLEPKFLAKREWRRAATAAINSADFLVKIGAHKSIVNRILEPFLHVNVLTTGTTNGWMNFFGLRLDKAAQPEIRVLAEKCWKVWNESKPQKLEPGQWHLPFIDDEDQQSFLVMSDPLHAVKISVARCARLSYMSFDTGKRSTMNEDFNLYKRLIGSTPIHASPAEHQATPDRIRRYSQTSGIIDYVNPEEVGNLGPGWRQYRKMLLGEAVAPLPSEYL